MPKILLFCLVLFLGAEEPGSAQEDPKTLEPRLKKDFSVFVEAVTSMKAEKVAELDASLADRMRGKLASETKAIMDDFKTRLYAPGRIVVQEMFGEEVHTKPEGYSPRVLFRYGKVVESAASVGFSATMRTRISFPEASPLIFVQKVDLKGYSPPPQPFPGVTPIKPAPMFSPMLFDPAHPFLTTAHWRQWDLALVSKTVRELTATFVFRTPADPKGRFLFVELAVDLESFK